MYKSPIDLTISAIQMGIVKNQEEQIMRAIQNVGVNVDKKELIKALNYDRQQYEKGYCDGAREFAERLLETIHEHHYLLSNHCNSRDYGMFTIGIEQAVNETKKEMAGDTE